MNEFCVFAFSVNVCITNKRFRYTKSFTQYNEINLLLNITSVYYIYVAHML